MELALTIDIFIHSHVIVTLSPDELMRRSRIGYSQVSPSHYGQEKRGTFAAEFKRGTIYALSINIFKNSVRGSTVQFIPDKVRGGGSSSLGTCNRGAKTKRVSVNSAIFSLNTDTTLVTVGALVNLWFPFTGRPQPPMSLGGRASHEHSVYSIPICYGSQHSDDSVSLT